MRVHVACDRRTERADTAHRRAGGGPLACSTGTRVSTSKGHPLTVSLAGACVLYGTAGLYPPPVTFSETWGWRREDQRCPPTTEPPASGPDPPPPRSQGWRAGRRHCGCSGGQLRGTHTTTNLGSPSPAPVSCRKHGRRGHTCLGTPASRVRACAPADPGGLVPGSCVCVCVCRGLRGHRTLCGEHRMSRARRRPVRARGPALRPPRPPDGITCLRLGLRLRLGLGRLVLPLVLLRAAAARLLVPVLCSAGLGRLLLVQQLLLAESERAAQKRPAAASERAAGAGRARPRPSGRRPPQKRLRALCVQGPRGPGVCGLRFSV